jgi:diguanylate cyclase (GGDEF)-like protein
VSSNGDQFGNEVLVKIAELLRKNIRGSDVVVRYGRDAFAVLLPNTVLSSALSLGNRFAAIIRNYPFVHGETQPKGRVTASVGLAFLDGQTPEELILCCERALSHAIKRGGDRVEIYSKEMDEAEAFPQT